MSPEELDIAIERLLEDNPNQEKPERRRRDKLKDLKRRVRNGKSVVSEKMVYDLVGEDIYNEIAYVEVSYDERKVYLGTVEGWYDDLNKIAETNHLDKTNIILEKNRLFEWHKDELYWDGTSRVYIMKYSVRLRYTGAHGRWLKSKGLFRDDYIVNGKPIEEGIYMYDAEMKALIDSEFGGAPNKKIVDKSLLNRLRYTPDELFKYDKKGKYKLHRKALEEQCGCHYYSGTIRIEKGDILGTTNKFISTVNDNFRNKMDFMEGADQEEQDLVGAYHDVVYEYIW